MPDRSTPASLDETIAALAEVIDAAGRSLSESLRPYVEAAAPALVDLRRLREQSGSWPHDDLARREWPHVPLSLARAYADEYVLTGRRP